MSERSRRSLLRSAGGAAVGLTGLFGTASAARTVPEASGGPAEDAPYTVVAYEKSEFQPVVLPIPAGGTVQFVGNRYPHTVTSTDLIATPLNDCSEGGEAAYNGEDASDYDGQKNNSDGVVEYTVEEAGEPFNVFLESGGAARITFEAPGRYPYYCIPHCAQAMVGEIVVGEGDA